MSTDPILAWALPGIASDVAVRSRFREAVKS